MSAAFEVPEAFWRYAARLAAGGQWPPDASTAGRFLATCRRHRLLPLAAASTTFPSALLPAARAAAAHDAASDARRHAAQAQTLARLRPWLAPGHWIAIKGLDYGRRCYPDPALRPMNDIDLLLRADTFETLLHELPARDFLLRPLANPLERTLEDRRNGVVLDLYRAFTRPQRVAIDYEALWSPARALDDGTPALAPAHALAVHALLMANQQFTTHLRKYLDLWLLARDEAVAREAAEWAARWRMRRAYAGSLMLLARIVPEFEAHAGFAAALRRLRRGERRWLQAAVLPASPLATLPWRPFALWRKVQLLDHWSQRFGLGLAHLAAAPAARSRP